MSVLSTLARPTINLQAKEVITALPLGLVALEPLARHCGSMATSSRPVCRGDQMIACWQAADPGSPVDWLGRGGEKQRVATVELAVDLSELTDVLLSLCV